MLNCLFCGSPRESSALFCGECGVGWNNPTELDSEDSLSKYAMNLQEKIFEGHYNDDGDERAAKNIDQDDRRIRKRLKISFNAAQQIRQPIQAEYENVRPLTLVVLEFDQNLHDAYAKQDTYLKFRVTNNTDTLLKAHLDWDDPDTPDEMDYKASTATWVKPGQLSLISSTHVFSRSGPKSIDKMFLKIERYDESVLFKLHPFDFFVGNPEANVINNISTTNQISVEGTGHIFKPGDVGGAQPKQSAQPGTESRWIRVSFSYVLPKRSVTEIPIITPKVQPTVSIERPIDACEPIPSNLTVAESAKAEVPLEAKKAINISDPAALLNVPDAVNAFFEVVEELIFLTPGGFPKRLVSTANCTIHLLKSVFDLTPDQDWESLVGIVVQDAELVYIDSHQRNLVTGFTGAATVISHAGVTVVSSTSSQIMRMNSHSWHDLGSLNLQCKRFGRNSFLVSLNEGNTVLPGCMFDLRQYKGDQSIETLCDYGSKLIERIRALGVETFGEKAHDEVDDKIDFTDGQKDLEVPIEDREEEDEILEVKPAMVDFDPIVQEKANIMRRFFSVFSFAMQRCSENPPRAIYSGDFVSEKLLAALSGAAHVASSKMQVVCINPNDGDYSFDGKLTGWRGNASVLSVDGIYHMTNTETGEYKLDGFNCFLSWRRLFQDIKADLFIRELGPDIWLGTFDKFFLLGGYCDYSPSVLQWDYFDEFVKRELLSTFDVFKETILRS